MAHNENRRYVVVEQAGNVGEQDVQTFDHWRKAWAFVERTYSAKERDQHHPDCLFVDVRQDWTDEDGVEHGTYEC